MNKQLVLAATCVAGVAVGLGLETQAALATGFGGQVLPANAIINGYSLTNAAEVHVPWLANGGPLPVTPFEQLVVTISDYIVTDSTYFYVPVFGANNFPPPFPDPFPSTLTEARFALFDPSQADLSGTVTVDGLTTVLGPEYLVGPVSYTQGGSTYQQYQLGTFLSPLAVGSHTVTIELLQGGVSQGSLTYNVQSNPTPVPTPALLPGLIAFGLSALRKRQAQH
ncbi:MAG: PTPA-CTERM sorting domain-containing protein [Nodosilinea sp.]